MARPLTAFSLLALLGACAYVLPATWQAYRIEPDDAPPAITRALDARQLEIASWDQAKDEIVTTWFGFNDGMNQTRERYLVSWSANPNDGTLTVYVRHEAQDREASVGGDWSGVYHDPARERALLAAITEEIQAQAAPVAPPAEE